jgi:hypothetical protein
MKKQLLYILLPLYTATGAFSLQAQIISSTTTQIGNNSIYPGDTTELLLRVDINLGINPVTLTDMTFNLNGSTFPLNDIDSVHLWQYNDSAILNTTYGLYMGTIANPDTGDFAFLTPPNANYSGMSSYSGMTVLKQNIFWLAIDMSPNAILCDTIDAEFVEFRADTVMYVPDVTAPPGFRVVGICPTGVPNDPAFAPVQAIPQPFHDELTILFGEGESASLVIEIFNMGGQKIATLFDGITNSGSRDLKVNTSAYPPGVYYMVSVSENKTATEKIIKM